MTDERQTDRIAQIRARAEKATKGPWRSAMDVGVGLPRVLAPKKRNGKSTVVALFPAMGKRDQVIADAEFMAHARQDISYLLDALSALLSAPSQVVEKKDVVTRFVEPDVHPSDVHAASNEKD